MSTYTITLDGDMDALFQQLAKEQIPNEDAAGNVDPTPLTPDTLATEIVVRALAPRLALHREEQDRAAFEAFKAQRAG